eukprot:scaffold130724_cov33-Phaeocystis_antarctica.AAC.1
MSPTSPPHPHLHPHPHRHSDPGRDSDPDPHLEVVTTSYPRIPACYSLRPTYLLWPWPSLDDALLLTSDLLLPTYQGRTWPH